MAAIDPTEEGCFATTRFHPDDSPPVRERSVIRMSPAPGATSGLPRSLRIERDNMVFGIHIATGSRFEQSGF